MIQGMLLPLRLNRGTRSHGRASHQVAAAPTLGCVGDRLICRKDTRVQPPSRLISRPICVQGCQGVSLNIIIILLFCSAYTSHQSTRGKSSAMEALKSSSTATKMGIQGRPSTPPAGILWEEEQGGSNLRRHELVEHPLGKKRDEQKR